MFYFVLGFVWKIVDTETQFAEKFEAHRTCKELGTLKLVQFDRIPDAKGVHQS
jgi:hypothetical protein